jgi:cytidine diphosphoramidate kinase
MRPSREHCGVIWICGLAGSGKTTLSRALFESLKTDVARIELIDGDIFRMTHMPEVGYDRGARLRVARAIHERAWKFATEGALSIVSTISLFHEIHDANCIASAHFNLPLLIALIEAPQQLRDLRRPKLATSRAPVVGLDIEPEYPAKVDHHYVNDDSEHAVVGQAEMMRQRWLAHNARAEASDA